MGSDAAAWWQAIISGAAIIASGAIAVFVPWNERRLERKRENRSRLDIDARTSTGSGLELLVSYRPEFHNHALSASISLIDPPDARLYRGVIDWEHSKGDRPKGIAGSLATNVRYHGMPLIEWKGSDRRNQYIGIMFVEYPDERKGPHRVKVEVSILIHGNFLIAKHMITISAMDVEFFPSGAPQAVLDMRKHPDKSI